MVCRSPRRRAAVARGHLVGLRLAISLGLNTPRISLKSGIPPSPVDVRRPEVPQAGTPRGDKPAKFAYADDVYPWSAGTPQEGEDAAGASSTTPGGHRRPIFGSAGARTGGSGRGGSQRGGRGGRGRGGPADRGGRGGGAAGARFVLGLVDPTEKATYKNLMEVYLLRREEWGSEDVLRCAGRFSSSAPHRLTAWHPWFCRARRSRRRPPSECNGTRTSTAR